MEQAEYVLLGDAPSSRVGTSGYGRRKMGQEGDREDRSRPATSWSEARTEVWNSGCLRHVIMAKDDLHHAH